MTRIVSEWLTLRDLTSKRKWNAPFFRRPTRFSPCIHNKHFSLIEILSHHTITLCCGLFGQWTRSVLMLHVKWAASSDPVEQDQLSFKVTTCFYIFFRGKKRLRWLGGRRQITSYDLVNFTKEKYLCTSLGGSEIASVGVYTYVGNGAFFFFFLPRQSDFSG